MSGNVGQCVYTSTILIVNLPAE